MNFLLWSALRVPSESLPTSRRRKARRMPGGIKGVDVLM